MSWRSTPFFFYWLLAGFYITSGQPPKPTITAIPSRVINRGDNVTIRCRTINYNVRFCLHNGYYHIQCLETKEYTADFPIINSNYNGNYYCHYYDSHHNPNLWSPYSDPLSIQVIDLRKPEITWDIDPEDRSKARVKCTAPEPSEEYQLLRCFLYKNRTPLTDKNFIANSLSCTFSVLVLDISELRCLYVVQVLDSTHQIRSPLSDSVEPANNLRKPEISWDIDPEDRSKASVKCTAPEPSEEYQLLRCLLYKNRTHLTDKNFIANSLRCTFSVLVSDISELRCLYVVRVLDSTHQIRSPLSDSVEPANSASVYVIFIAVSLTVLLVVTFMLIMAYIIMRKRRASKKKMDSGLPQDDQMVNADEVTYCTLDETVKVTDLDEKQNVQKSDDNIDSDGITYAVLNKDALKRNTLGKVPTVDNSIYAQVHKGTKN